MQQLLFTVGCWPAALLACWPATVLPVYTSGTVHLLVILQLHINRDGKHNDLGGLARTPIASPLMAGISLSGIGLSDDSDSESLSDFLLSECGQVEVWSRFDALLQQLRNQHSPCL